MEHRTADRFGPFEIDGLRPTVVRVVEPGVPAQKREVAPAGVEDILGFSSRADIGRHDHRGRNAEGLQRFEAHGEQVRGSLVANASSQPRSGVVAVSGCEVGAQVDPGAGSFREFRVSRHVVLKADMAQLVPGVCGEDHVATARLVREMPDARRAKPRSHHRVRQWMSTRSCAGS